MYKRIAMIISLSLLVGCAAKQECPKMPTNVCEQCKDKVESGARDAATSGASIFSAGVELGLATLQYSLSYLLAKEKDLEAWIAKHPDMSGDAKKELDSLRERIQSVRLKIKERL